MRASIILRSSGSGKSLLPGTPKLLLPPPTFLQNASAALHGAWSHVVDQSARDAYEEAVDNQVIKDDVLESATGGAAITFTLFHNLQNPLLKEHKFDAKEFVIAVGPALENFHDTLSCLRNQLPDSRDKIDEQLEETLKQSDEELLASLSQDNIVTSLLGVNHWSQQAEEDSDSLAGRLSKMTTDACLDAFYYTSKLDVQNRATLDGASSGPNKYVPGSCKVNEVALLNARAMVLDDAREEGKEDFGEHPEFQASEENYWKKQDSKVAGTSKTFGWVVHSIPF
jgi:hypothetical protein